MVIWVFIFVEFLMAKPLGLNICLCVSGFISEKNSFFFFTCSWHTAYNLSAFLKLFILINYENKRLSMYLGVFVIFFNYIYIYIIFFGSQNILGLHRKIKVGQETGNTQFIFMPYGRGLSTAMWVGAVGSNLITDTLNFLILYFLGRRCCLVDNCFPDLHH